MKSCKCPDCTKEAKVAGQCWSHYNKLRNYGTWFPMDTCTVCGKPFVTTKKGRKYCDDCQSSAYASGRAAWRESHTDYLRESKARYYREHAEEIKARVRQYGHEHRQERIEYNRKWRENNRDRARASALRWSRNNTSSACNTRAHKESVRRRRNRLRDNQTFIVTDRDINRLLERYHWCCAYCGDNVREGYVLDHVVPVARGGVNGIGNYLPSCPWCNKSKGAKTLTEWKIWKLKVEKYALPQHAAVADLGQPLRGRIANSRQRSKPGMLTFEVADGKVEELKAWYASKELGDMNG